MEGEKKKLKERHGERGMGEKERAVNSRKEWKRHERESECRLGCITTQNDSI